MKRRIFLVFSLLSWNATLFAEDVESQQTIDLFPKTLRVVWNTEKTPSVKSNQKAFEQSKKVWSETCQTMGQSYLKTQGPFASGIFDDFSCVLDGKVIYGKVASNDAILEITEKDKLANFTLTLKTKTGLPYFGQIQTPASEYLFLMLRDEEMQDLITIGLLDQLPNFGMIKLKVDDKGMGLIRFRGIRYGLRAEKISTMILPYKKVQIYALGPDPSGKLLKARVYGKATLKDNNVVYVIEASEGQTGMDLWFTSFDGQSKMKPDIERELTRIVEKLNEVASEGFLEKVLEGQKNFVASGYTAFRFGKQILKGDPLMEKASFYGILFEMKKGIMKGWRINADFVPNVENELQVGQTNLGWSRYLIGRSFAWKFESKFIDEINVTPKIGIWNFAARLVTYSSETGETLGTEEFKTRNALSMGIEPGVEKSLFWSDFRLWYAYDMAPKFGPSQTSRVSSHRLGLDAYWRLGTQFNLFSFPFRLAIIGFYFTEQVNLQKESELDGKQILSSFQGDYAGAALGVTW